MLHIFRKAYFEDPIHVFGVLYLTKLNFGFHVKNIDIYLIRVLDFIHTQYASKEFKYLVFVFILYASEKIETTQILYLIVKKITMDQ